MNKIIDSVRDSLRQENWYAALFAALTLPDICVALEHGKGGGEKYSAWFEESLKQYGRFLSGDDCYALRCSLLHHGKDDITGQRVKDVLDHYIFLTSGPHLILFKDCTIDGVKKSFLQLNVGIFCEDICTAVESWLVANVGNQDVQDRAATILEIHEPGYIHMGAIRFG